MLRASLAFILCVLLGVGGAVAGLVGLSSASKSFSSDYPWLDFYSLRGVSDLLSNGPYQRSNYFMQAASRDVSELVSLCHLYRAGAEMEGATSSYESETYGNDIQRSYAAAVEHLDGKADYYVAGLGVSGQAITNMRPSPVSAAVDPSVLLKEPAYLSVVFQASSWEITESGGFTDMGFLNTVSFDVWSDDATLYLKGVTLYIAWPQSVMEDGAAALSDARGASRSLLICAVAALTASLVLFVLLLVRTGRRRADGTHRLYAWDRVFIEIQIAVMTFTSGVVLNIFSSFGSLERIFLDGTYAFEAGLLIAISAAVCAVELGCLLSIVRICKARLLPRRLIVWIVLRQIGRGVRGLARAVKSGFDGRNPIAKTVVLVALFWLATILIAVAIAAWPSYGFFDQIFWLAVLFAVPVLALYFSVKWAKRYGELKRGVEEIAGGNLSYKIPVQGPAASEFEKLSMKINEIGGASELAMQSELKNQRLRTDLISNVSHDLKTPLTSIITYTDILKKEGLYSENAPEYLAIIDEKGRRLKKLTEDLFEAAKASSGAMPVRGERVDLLALMNQELVEHGDGLAGIGLEVVVGAPHEHYYVKADSQLLWRVVDNLLNNVRKYAMPGSRVYIDLAEYKPAGNARPATSLEIKNTSAAMLNIPADELMERFQRGDESRATEGSGLGLSIAGDLTRLMNGNFEIAIDGDLFKASLTLESSE
jgi:signal transduction histidine kinase